MGEKKLNREEGKRFRKAVDDVVLDNRFLDALVKAGRDAEARKHFAATLKKSGLDLSGSVKVDTLDEQGTWGVRLSATGKGAGGSVVFRVSEGEVPVAGASDDREQFKRAYREVEDVMASDAVLGVIETALANEEEYAKFKADPQAVLKAKGVSLPKNATISATDRADGDTTPQQEGTYYRQVCYQVCEGWFIFVWCRQECWWELIYY